MMQVCDNCQISLSHEDCPENHSLCDPCVSLRNKDQSIWLSPLKRADLELVLAWRSNPKVYRHFRQQDNPLTWNEHVNWFESRRPECHDFVIHYDGRRVGVVSLDTENEVGIYLGDFSAHGHGVATAALNWLCERFENRSSIAAKIHKENTASKRLFGRCGFEQIGRDDEWLQYAYKP